MICDNEWWRQCQAVDGGTNMTMMMSVMLHIIHAQFIAANLSLSVAFNCRIKAAIEAQYVGGMLPQWGMKCANERDIIR